MKFDPRKVSDAADRLLGIKPVREDKGAVHAPEKPGTELKHDDDLSDIDQADPSTMGDASKVGKGKIGKGKVHDKVAPQFKESIHAHIKRLAQAKAAKSAAAAAK